MSRLCNNKPDEPFSFSARSQFRRAQLHAKRNAEAAKRKERELLFEGIREGKEPVGSFGRRKGGQEKLSQDELLLNATNDVTAALRETHSLMQVEVSRSQFAHETLRKNSMPKQKLTSSLFKPKAYVQKNNQRPHSQLCRKTTAASTAFYPPPVPSSPVYYILRNQTPGISKVPSTSLFAQSRGFSSAASSMVQVGG